MSTTPAPLATVRCDRTPAWAQLHEHFEREGRHFDLRQAFAADAGRDTIKDFVHGTDKIQIEHYYYGGIESQGGPIAAAEFITGTAATTANQNLIYNQATGILYYDADGIGAQPKIAIAYFEGKPVLDASDIVMI